jgi:hypothetical protein
MLRPLHPVHRLTPFVLTASLLCACACSAEPDSGGAGGGAAEISGQFAGVYEVPTQPELARAAEFPVDRVSWRVSAGSATLTYDLPKELLGKSLDLSFTGPIDAAGTATLTGEAGSAECSTAARTIACREVLDGLSPLEPDLEAVEQLAAKTYAGSAQDRIDVARLFSNDPIGIVTFDLDARRAED